MKKYCMYNGETYLGVGLLINHSETDNTFTSIIYIQNRLIEITTYVSEYIDDEGLPQADLEVHPFILAEYISCPEWDEILDNEETPDGNITF